MKYLKRIKGSEEWIEVTKEQVVYTLEGTYKADAIEEVLGFLDAGFEVECMFAQLKTQEED